MRDKKLPPEIRALLKEESIKYRTAIFLNSLPKTERPLLFRLFREVKQGVNKQREIIEWLEDITKRDDKKVDAILDQTGLEAILSDIALNGPQKGDLFRERLFALRFPEVSTYLKRLKSALSALALPDGVKLVPVTPLEDGEFRLEMTFNSAGDLDEKLSAIKEILGSGALKALWA
jgi:hypothetical protein